MAPLEAVVDLCDTGAWGTAVPEGQSGTPVVRSTNIQGGRLILSDVAERRLRLSEIEAKSLEPNDILVVLSSGSPAHLGKCCLVQNLERPMAFSNFVLRLRPTTDSVEPGWLYRWLSSQRFRSRLFALSGTTTGLRNISRRLYKSQPVPLPPLDEQRRIARLLDEADALRRKRHESLQLLDDLLQATFLDMFGDPVTNPRGWDTVKLRELIESGPSNGLYLPASEYGSGTPIVRIDSFEPGGSLAIESLKRVRASEDEIAKYGLRPGQLLINRVNARTHLGKAALVPTLDEPTVFESNMMRIQLDKSRVLPEFLVQQLSSDYVRGQVMTCSKDAVNQSSINQQDVRGFRIRLPDVASQQRWIDQLATWTATRNSARNHAIKASCLFDSLLYEAFSSGE